MKSILGLLPGDWVTKAACGQENPDDWFPRRGGRPASHRTAMATCEACPVRPECLDYITRIESGFPLRDRHGIWAGLTPRRRYADDPTISSCARCRRPFPRGTRSKVCPDCQADAIAATCTTCLRPFSGKGPAGRPVVDCQPCRRERRRPHLTQTTGVSR